MTLSLTFAVLAALALHLEAANFEIESCQDFVSAAEATASEDTVAIVNPTATIDCGADYVAVQIKNNALVVEAAESTSSDLEVVLQNLRFEVFDSGELTWGPKAAFFGDVDITLEADGGWLNVAEGSKALFLDDVSTTNFVIRSVVEDGMDFSNEQFDGGCVWNAGYFQVDGFAAFQGCDNIGGGESSPGPGGTMLNTETGSVLFAGGVSMEDSRLTDNEGNSGAGIFNLGEVNIEGDSLFRELVADTSEAAGGAIFNAAGGKVTFSQDASAAFIESDAGRGGAIYNAGDFEFGGPARFTMCRFSAIFNVGSGTMKLSENSVFTANEADNGGGAITNLGSATLEIPSVIFFDSNLNESTGTCQNIFVQENATDDGTGINSSGDFVCLF